MLNQAKLLNDTFRDLKKCVSWAGCSDEQLKMFYRFIKYDETNIGISEMIKNYEYLECCNVNCREINTMVNSRYKEIEEREKQVLGYIRSNDATARFQQDTQIFGSSSTNILARVDAESSLMFQQDNESFDTSYQQDTDFFDTEFGPLERVDQEYSPTMINQPTKKASNTLQKNSTFEANSIDSKKKTSKHKK